MTLDEARLMANVNARARRLFEDGYRARWKGPHLLAVRSGLGAVYELDTKDQACGCPFFLKSGHPCKHILGWRRLLARQKALRRLLALLLLRAWADLDDGCFASTQERQRIMAKTEPLFTLGQTVATPGALAAMGQTSTTPEVLLARHAAGDWGAMSEDDRQRNNAALLSGERLLSAYDLPDGIRIWIITESDRSVTTLLLPGDY